MKEEKQNIWETHFKIRKKTTQIQIKKNSHCPVIYKMSVLKVMKQSLFRESMLATFIQSLAYYMVIFSHTKTNTIFFWKLQTSSAIPTEMIYWPIDTSWINSSSSIT